MRMRFCALAAMAVAALVLVGSSFATTGLLVITTSTTLSEDHQGSIVISGTGVTLDCAGHRVTGSGVGVGVGINVVADGVTVTRCQVQGFDVGIQTSAASTRILANVLKRNNQGVRLAGGTNATVSRNIASENRDFGIIAAEGANGATIGANAANNNGLIGIALNTATNNVVAMNVANQNGETGIDVAFSSSYNRILNNAVVKNGNHGVHLFESDNNTIVGNVAYSNGTPGNGTGFAFNSSSGNTVSRNVALKNGGVGFHVFLLSQSNTFTQNVACGNFFTDAADISTGSGNNWSNNAFCKSEGI
jgi:parallel beta-helix repeat protein